MFLSSKMLHTNKGLPLDDIQYKTGCVNAQLDEAMPSFPEAKSGLEDSLVVTGGDESKEKTAQ